MRKNAASAKLKDNMKTLILFAVVALLIGGGISIYIKRQPVPQRNETLDASLATGASAVKSPSASGDGLTVLVEAITGTVEITLPSGEQKTLSGKTTAPVAATIKTPPQSRTRLTFPDGSTARIDERTEVKILDLAKGETTFVSVKLTGGRIFSRVKQLLSGSRYEVRTSNTLAAVRGTGFDVVRIGGKTRVTTLEDTVLVRALNPATDEVITEIPAVEVGKLQTVTLDEAAPPTPEKPPARTTVRTEDIQVDPWLIFNVEEEIKKEEPLPEILGLKLSIPTPSLQAESPRPTATPQPSPSPRLPTPKPSPAPVELIEPEELIATPSPTPIKTPTPSPTPSPVASIKFSITQVSPETVDTRFEDFSFRIFGTGFEPGARAFIGNIALKSVVVRSATEITALIPKGTPPAAYDVIVVNPDGERAVLGGGVFAVAEFQ